MLYYVRHLMMNGWDLKYTFPPIVTILVLFSYSVGSIPTPEGFTGSVSASSDDFEMIESNGRPPTPKLNEAGFEQRHHLDRTTPAVGKSSKPTVVYIVIKFYVTRRF